MLSEITIQNFKAFEGSHTAPLGPITLIFGNNSAGKSSIIQSLLLLKQSLNQGGRRQRLVARGDHVDLGSFESLVHGHNLELEVGIGVASKLPLTVGRPQFVSGRIQSRISDVSGVGIELLFGQQNLQTLDGLGDDQTGIRLSYGGEVIRPSRDPDPLTGVGGPNRRNQVLRFNSTEVSQLVRWADDISAQHPSWESDPGHSGLEENTTAAVDLQRGFPANFRVDENARNVDSTVRNVWLESFQRRRELREEQAELTDIVSSIQEILLRSPDGLPTPPTDAVSTKSLDLEALRNQEEQARLRISEIQREIDLTRKSNGYAGLIEDVISTSSSANQRAVGRLQYLGPLRAAPERFNVLSGKRFPSLGDRGENLVDLLAESPTLLNQVNLWLARLEIPYEIQVRKVSDGALSAAIGAVHCLVLRDIRRGVDVSPADVGFGIGQILPVVVASFTAPNVLCIEQPEIHLHPALQANLAELFTFAYQNGIRGEVQRQFILETHSEHMILRFQRLIRLGRLSPKDLCVLHVGFDDGGKSTIRQLRIDDQGQFIDHWPGGFFDERFDEIFGG